MSRAKGEHKLWRSEFGPRGVVSRSRQWAAILGLGLKQTSVRKAGEKISIRKGFKTFLPSPGMENTVAQREKAALGFEEDSLILVHPAHCLCFTDTEHSGK